MRYLMGIDNGGTSIKCAIFDTLGTEVAAHTMAAPISQPAPGFVERDLRDVWAWNSEVIRSVLAKSGVDAAQIAAISICGYGGGACLLQRDGTPAAPGVVSTDTRAAAQVDELRAMGVEARFYARTRQHFWPGQPAPLLRWFRQNLPEIFARTAHVLMIKDYIRYKLTGRLYTELTDASNNGLIDLATGELAFEGLENCAALFPLPLLRPSDLAGHITPIAAAQTGLCAGTPVAAGLYDVAACAAAAALKDSKTLCLITGTWSINCRLADDPPAAGNSGVVTAAYLPNKYLIEESSATSAGNLDWLVRRLLMPMHPGATLGDLYRLCAEALTRIKPEDSDVVFVPYLYSSATTPGAHGAFFNLQNHHGPEELTRAVMEGILFSTLRHVETLCKDAPPFTHVRLTGGVTASPPWTQMLADMLRRPVEIMEGSEQGAQGAALCAGVLIGVFDHFVDGMQKMLHVRKIFLPSQSTEAIYKIKYSLYNRAVCALQCFHQASI